MNRVLFVLFFAISVILDITSKNFVLEYFSKNDKQFVSVIDNFFNIGLTYNQGVAFGFMTSWSDQVRIITLTFTSIVAFCVLLYFLCVVYKNNKVAISFLALIFGGAVGNLIDRLRYGAVVDFLDFYFKEYHWPMFNVADSFICIGVFALILLPNGKSEKSEGTKN